MTQEEFTNMMSAKIKLIRTEYGLTQETMCDILGISKKSLVETEKGRRRLSWSEAALAASIFDKSEIVQNAFGGEASDIIRAIAFGHRDVKYPPTMGGKIWWRRISSKGGYVIQQNVVSGHYRLLDSNDCRLMSSFDRKEVEEYRDSLGDK